MKEKYEVVIQLHVDRNEFDDPESWDWCTLLDIAPSDLSLISAKLVDSENKDAKGNVIPLRADYTSKAGSDAAKGRGRDR